MLALAGETRSLLQGKAGVRVPEIDPARLEVVHDAYGGAYGRAHPDAERAARVFEARTGIRLESTYGAKGLLTALRLAAMEPVLFCVTFGAAQRAGH